MKLVRLTIRTLPGLHRTLELRPDPDRACVVLGPNASGKTSLLRALGLLLDPDPKAAEIDLEAEFSDGESIVHGRALGPTRTWRIDGRETERPDWPGPGSISAYLVRADALGAAGEPEGEFAATLKRAMAGGFDLDALAAAPAFAVPPRPRKLARSLAEAEQAVERLEREQARLADEVDALDDLRLQRDASIEAGRKLGRVGRAGELLRIERSIGSLKDALEEFPQGMDRLDGSEGERLAQLGEDETRLEHELASDGGTANRRSARRRRSASTTSTPRPRSAPRSPSGARAWTPTSGDWPTSANASRPGRRRTHRRRTRRRPARCGSTRAGSRPARRARTRGRTLEHGARGVRTTAAQPRAPRRAGARPRRAGRNRFGGPVAAGLAACRRTDRRGLDGLDAAARRGRSRQRLAGDLGRLALAGDRGGLRRPASAGPAGAAHRTRAGGSSHPQSLSGLCGRAAFALAGRRRGAAARRPGTQAGRAAAPARRGRAGARSRHRDQRGEGTRGDRSQGRGRRGRGGRAGRRHGARYRRPAAAAGALGMAQRRDRLHAERREAAACQRAIAEQQDLLRARFERAGHGPPSNWNAEALGIWRVRFDQRLDKARGARERTRAAEKAIERGEQALRELHTRRARCSTRPGSRMPMNLPIDPAPRRLRARSTSCAASTTRAVPTAKSWPPTRTCSRASTPRTRPASATCRPNSKCAPTPAMRSASGSRPSRASAGPR